MVCFIINWMDDDGLRVAMGGMQKKKKKKKHSQSLEPKMYGVHSPVNQYVGLANSIRKMSEIKIFRRNGTGKYTVRPEERVSVANR